MRSSIISILCIGIFVFHTSEGSASAELQKQCRYADAWRNEYKEFFKISDLPGVRSNDYLVNITLYVRAQRDAHILLTTGPRAIRSENEYEIVIGGWGGSKTVIRRKQQSQEPLTTAKHSPIISRHEWNEYLLQVTKSGDIKLYRMKRNDSYILIVKANDPELIPVEYISFGSWDNHHVEFYFNCPSNLIKPDSINDNNFPFENCANENCRNQCQYADAWENEYKDFFKIIDLPGARPKDYVLNFPFYVRAQRDAHVLLTTGPRADRSDNEYEIVIGGWGGSQSVIRRKQQSQQPLATAKHSPIISRNEWNEFLLQVTRGGDIKLYRREGNDSYNLIVKANDAELIPIEYISFGSWEDLHVEFYFNCPSNLIKPDTIVDRKLPMGACENNDCRKKCQYADAWQNEYNDFFRITDLPGVRSKDYIVNFPFYVRAQRDAHILLTTGPRAIRSDNEYEIVIGGWGGSQSVIRRKQQSQEPLATIHHTSIISSNEWNEYLLRVTGNGIIKLFRREGNDSYSLVMQAHDNELIPVEYMSFGSWDNHHVEFYFNCSSKLVEPEKIVDLNFDNSEIGLLHNTTDLERTCQYADAWQNEYTDFFKITDLPGVRPKGFVINFPFYVQAERDAHILLTAGPRAIRSDNEYEIVIGGWSGSQSVIRRQQQSQEPLATVRHPKIISRKGFTEFLLQITSNGDIKLFRMEEAESNMLIVGAHEFDLLPVEYISFGSWDNNHVEFYFNCSFNNFDMDVRSNKV